MKDCLMQCDECRQRKVVEDGEYCEVCLVATKECRSCHSVLSIFEFQKNQRTPTGVVNRRADCKDCRKKREGKKPTAKQKQEFYKTDPRPPIGDTFQCPICHRIFTVSNNQSINLDHDHKTGEIRGWICGSCNTAVGKLEDDISILARAIIWIKSAGKGFSNFIF